MLAPKLDCGLRRVHIIRAYVQQTHSYFAVGQAEFMIRLGCAVQCSAVRCAQAPQQHTAQTEGRQLARKLTAREQASQVNMNVLQEALAELLGCSQYSSMQAQASPRNWINAHTCACVLARTP